MPPPFPDRNVVRAEILRRVSAGETLKAICAEPGMPKPRTVYGWTWVDPMFDADLAQAVRRGRWMQVRAFDEAKAAVFLRRLAAGEAVTALIKDPTMPSEGTLAYWRASQGPFAQEVARLVHLHRVARGQARGQARRAAYRPWTQAEGDRVLVRVGRGEPIPGLCKSDPSLPAPWLIERWRQEHPDFARDLAAHIRMGRRKRPGRYGAARRAAALRTLYEALVAGGSFNSVQGRDGLPTRRTLGRWMREDAAFAQAVADACQQREDGLLAAQIHILERAGSLSTRALRRKLAPLKRRLASLRTRPGMRRRA